jgi:DNA-binding NarL/FixJ family response regulator
MANTQIGRRLSLTEGTVTVHLGHIYQKLGVANRTSLTVLALAGQSRGRSGRA